MRVGCPLNCVIADGLGFTPFRFTGRSRYLKQMISIGFKFKSIANWVENSKENINSTWKLFLYELPSFWIQIQGRWVELVHFNQISIQFFFLTNCQNFPTFFSSANQTLAIFQRSTYMDWLRGRFAGTTDRCWFVLGTWPFIRFGGIGGLKPGGVWGDINRGIWPWKWDQNELHLRLQSFLRKQGNLPFSKAKIKKIVIKLNR